MCNPSCSISRNSLVGPGRGPLDQSASLRRTPPSLRTGLLGRSMALRTTLESIARIAQRPPTRIMRAGCRGVRSAPTGAPPCAGPPPPRACACAPSPRPPCRARARERVEALKVTCCPPEKAPCPPCLTSQPLNCSSRKLSSKGPNFLGDSKKSCIPNEPVDRCGQACGNANDRVERRLAAEERVRREQYEQEAAERGQRACARPAAARYCLGQERECARATDGRQYAVVCGKQPVPRCGPGRAAPPPQCVQLDADDNCKIQGAQHMDPCAHRRRTILQIDRSQANAGVTANAMMKSVDDPAVTVSKQPCDTKCDEKSCEIKRSNPPPAPPCRQPTVTETLRARGSKPKDQSPPQARSLHTSSRYNHIIHGNVSKTRKNLFCTNKLISASNPDIKIITFNRATSPLVKQMSANNCGEKTGSWASFEKLRKICQAFVSNKKHDKILNMSSSRKMPPPCGPPTDTTKPEVQRIPANPCAPKPKDKKQNQSTNPCARKKPNTCGQKTQKLSSHKRPNSPCAQKSNPAGQKNPNSPCGQKQEKPPSGQKTSSSPCAQQKPKPPNGQSIPDSPCAQKNKSSSPQLPPPCQPCGTPRR